MIDTVDDIADAEPSEGASVDTYFHWLNAIRADGKRAMHVLAETQDRTAVSIGRAAGISKGRVHEVLRFLMGDGSVSRWPGENGRAPRFRNEYPPRSTRRS